MPNWCFSSVSILGDEKEIKVLSKEFNKALDKDSGLISLLTHLGLDETAISSIPHRGEINYYDCYKNQIVMDVESAWSPHLEPIRLFVEKYAPSANIFYTAEEPGCGVFLTNEENVAGNWRVVYDGTNPALHGLADYYNNDELKSILEEAVHPKEEMGLYQLLAYVNDNDDEFYIDKFEYCPIEEL